MRYNNIEALEYQDLDIDKIWYIKGQNYILRDLIELPERLKEFKVKE